MTRAEIGRKFDDIVAFSEIAEFLDTPVKRYSTGMFVRLAFAVAAHLEPEILLVDEVLVGRRPRLPAQVPRADGADRRTRDARSSSSATTWAPCAASAPACVEIEEGRLVADGPSDEVREGYIAKQMAAGRRGAPPAATAGQARRAAHHRGPRGRRGRQDARGRSTAASPSTVEIDVDVARENAAYQVGFDLLSDDGLISAKLAHRRAAGQLAADDARAQHPALRAPRRAAERGQLRGRATGRCLSQSTGSSTETTRSGSTSSRTTPSRRSSGSVIRDPSPRCSSGRRNRVTRHSSPEAGTIAGGQSITRHEA